MNDHSDAPRVWASKGEAVTCIRGHAIVDIARTVYFGDSRSAADFTNWHQPEPSRDTSVAELRCAKCRGVWIRGNPRSGYQMHFGADPDPTQGWR